MSIEGFLEGLRLGWGQKYSLSIRDVGFESLEVAKDLTEEDIRNLVKDSLEKAGALPLHILTICKGMVKAACNPMQNVAASTSLPLQPQDDRINMSAHVPALVPAIAPTTTAEDYPPTEAKTGGTVTLCQATLVVGLT
jgi:hypothetical protein